MIKRCTQSAGKPVLQVMHRSVLAVLIACGVLAASPVLVRACDKIIDQAVDASEDAIIDDIESLSNAVSEGFENLIDTLPKLANQGSNDDQNFTNSYAGMADHEATTMHANEVAQARVRNAIQMVPSRTTCGILTQQRSLAQSEAAYRTDRLALQKASTYYSLNAPGTPGEKGALAALNWDYQHRCSTYADAAALDKPPGCTGATNPALIDYDITPQKSIFRAYTYGSADFRKAALDSVNLLTEPAPLDALRGDALSREAGRNIHVLRMRDITRMNIARDILQDSVALRSAPATAGADGRKISRFSRLVELMVGTTLSGTDHADGTMTALATQAAQQAKTAAGEPENANVQALAAKLTAQKMMLTEMLRMTEQMVAVAAVNLAADIEESRRGNIGINSRVLAK